MMRISKVRAAGVLTAILVATTAHTFGQAATEPYKLGMFRQGDRTFVGLVLKDSVVIELAKAGITTPPSLKELIASWDAATGNRIGQVASAAAKQTPAYALQLSAVKTLPPITNPSAMLNMAVNYQEHANEMSRSGAFTQSDAVDPKVQQGIPGMWTRKPNDPRQNPYFFPKMPGAITGNGDPIILPAERSQIDWECELAVIIGKPAKNVGAERAADYIFGYTLENDVSDRGGRADGRHGSDWLIGKSHDTFAPLGPFIVPKQFVPNPQKLGLKFTLSGKVMQDSNTDRMMHTVAEVVEFGSRILTLQPGDILATGSPAGVGTARATPIYFKEGDTAVCTIESIGTLTNPIRAER
jgi:2-keto-4-pentenoate hydratase/2-oxohepta-3-ene-1,7-dioic acid hydratase in catechol pathway